MLRGMPHKDSPPSIQWLTEEAALFQRFGLHHSDFASGVYKDEPHELFQDALMFCDEWGKEEQRQTKPKPQGMGRRSG